MQNKVPQRMRGNRGINGQDRGEFRHFQEENLPGKTGWPGAGWGVNRKKVTTAGKTSGIFRPPRSPKKAAPGAD
jgi:hypothetical protein